MVQITNYKQTRNDLIIHLVAKLWPMQQRKESIITLLMPAMNDSLTAWSAKLQGPEANVIKCFIVKDHAFICILHQLMH